MDLPHQQNTEIKDIQMCWSTEPKANCTETNKHLKPENKKKISGFKKLYDNHRILLRQEYKIP
jgi:hypothetical protein